MNFENYIVTAYTDDLAQFYSDIFKSVHGFRPRTQRSADVEADIAVLKAGIERVKEDREIAQRYSRFGGCEIIADDVEALL